MAWADCCTTIPQPAGYTRAHSQRHTLATLSATTQLATVCVLPSSLLQASRSALRQGKPTHTLSHTHTSSLLHSHIFWKGRDEERAKARRRCAFLRPFYKRDLQLNPADISGISLLVLKVVSKRFGVSSLQLGIYTTW